MEIVVTADLSMPWAVLFTPGFAKRFRVKTNVNTRIIYS
jgi:hypothetical protein